MKTKEMVVLPQFSGFFDKADYKVALGGRGRGASTAMAQALIYFSSQFGIKIVNARQYMSSIRDSSKSQIEQIIYDMSLESEWTIQDQTIENKSTGAVMLFKGLEKSILSIKSIPDIDILAIEEAESLNQDTYNIAIPSVRKAGSEVWVVGNNRFETDPTSKYFLGEHPPENMILMRASYLDNPHCSTRFISDAELLKKKDIELYRHVYLGEFLKQSAMRLVKRIRKGDAETKDTDWVVIGVDIAGDGGDKTVFFVRSGLSIIHYEIFDTMDLDTLILVLNRLIARFNPHIVNIDSTGFGALAPQALARSGIVVRGINFASSAHKEEAYSNRRTEMYALVQEFFDMGGVCPDISELVRDLEQTLFKLDIKNRYQMLPKKEIKQIIGCSPDFGDAFALTMLVDGDNLITCPNRRVIEYQNMRSSQELLDAYSFDA